jgi:glycosyltransferase involved in cell wall biosynthesis
MDSSPMRALQAVRELASGASSREPFEKLLKAFRPDVVHVHNTFPLISPSVFGWAKAMGIRTVFTAHNYRAFCSNGLMLRKSEPCELCVQGSRWAGVQHACYRDSYLGSWAMRGMIQFHVKRDTWNRDIDQICVLNPLAARRFETFGVSPQRLSVLPNCAEDPGPPPDPTKRAKTLSFIGRWSEEKGILQLLKAWRFAATEGWGLRIGGSGPLDAAVAREVQELKSAGFSAEILGPLSREGVRKELHTTGGLAFPSICEENFPLILTEAMAHGTPIVSATHGALDWILGSAREPISPRSAPEILGEELRSALKRIGADPKSGMRGRERFLNQFTTRHHLQSLERVYAPTPGTHETEKLRNG